MSNRRNLHLSGLLVGLCLCASALFAARLNAQSTTTVTNVFQNHYHYGYSFGSNDCPTGYNIPSGQYPSIYHLERGHAIHHLDPKNAANDYWVYWAHFDNASYGVAEIAIFKSTTECGPYNLQTGLGSQYNVDGGGYGFQPGGWQSRDDNFFRDANTQTYNTDGSVANYASSYLIAASNDLGTQKSPSGSTCNYANDSVAIFKMTPDYLGIDATASPSTNGANWAFVCAQREAPVMFQQGSSYFLITSQAAGWYPSQGGYGVSTNPLTGWTPSPIALGNTSTFGGQTSDGFVIQGTQATTYMLTLDHLGGADSKNAASNEKTDTGEIWLPVILDGASGTATLNWEPSFTVDNTTGVLTLPTLTNLATAAAVSATVASTANPPALAIDGIYTTRWNGTATGSSSFNAAAPTAGTLCPLTNATGSTPCNPSLIVDVGSVQPIQQIDLSWYMVKGSEPYYTFKIAYSSDEVTWTTQDYTSLAPSSNAAANNLGIVPFSNNVTYGFNSLPVNFSARYVALLETGVVQQNSTSPFYGPGAYEMGIIQSTAPASPQPVTVSVTPSVTGTSPSNAFTVGVTVAGPTGMPMPSGYVQLSAPGYVSEIYGLASGANSFTIPAGILGGGNNTLTASFRPDPSSAPVYGIATTTGSASVNVTTPDSPSNFTVTKTSPGALTAAWTASPGALSYALSRSSDGGNTYTPFATASTTSYVDTGLSNDSTLYCYTVAAVNAAGAGSSTAPVCSTATATFPVTGIAVTPSGPGALTIAYTAVANATSYVIQRAVGGGASSTLTTTAAKSYLDSGLAVDGTIYCYTVAAAFSTGAAAASAPVCSTASANFFPTGLAVSKWAPGALRLTWVSNGGATNTYALMRSVGGAAYTTVATNLSSPQYVDGSLTNDTVFYCYTVGETVNGVSSPASAPVCNTPTASFLAIPNYGFEAPSISLWSTGPTDISNGTWVYVGTSGSTSGNNSGLSNKSGTWSNGQTAPEGAQVAFLEAKGSVTQTVSGFTIGQTYTILIAAEQRQTTSQSGPNPFSIAVNGTSLGTLSPPQAIPYFVDYGGTFTATSAANSVAFAGTSTSATSAVLVDNVRIVAATPVVTATQSAAQPTLPLNVPVATFTPVSGGGGSGPLLYTVWPTLPAGLSLSSTTGAVTGTPTVLSPAATYTVTVDDTNGGTSTATFSLTVARQAANITLSVSAANVNPNQTEVLTATVAGAVNGTPTGTVTFLDGTTALATVPLVSGSATYSLMLLSGTHSIALQYSGDNAYLASSTSGATIITAPPLDFSMTSTSPAYVMANGGQAVTFTFAIAPKYGVYPGPVSFTVTGLPPGATCTLTPPSIPATGGAQTVTLVVQTVSTHALNVGGQARGIALLAMMLVFLLPARCRLTASRLRASLRLLVLGAGVLGLVGLTGCSSFKPYFPPQQYGIVLTETSGPMTYQSIMTIDLH